MCKMALAKGLQLGTGEAQETEQQPRGARDLLPERVQLQTTGGSLRQDRGVRELVRERLQQNLDVSKGRLCSRRWGRGRSKGGRSSTRTRGRSKYRSP